jgi:hypothetical protein
MKNAVALICTAVLASTAAAQNNATGPQVFQKGALEYQYFPTLYKEKSDVAGGNSIRLQGRFIWEHSIPGTPSTVNGIEHAIVAFTQGEQSGQYAKLWTHGAGAFVDHNGLNMELWFMGTDPTDNSYGPKAYHWHQNNNRCQIPVNYAPSYVLPSPICLSANPADGSFVQSAPGFVLQKGVYYWVRVTLTHVNYTEYTYLTAELFQEGASANPIQTAQIGFQQSQFLPFSEALKASFARTTNGVDVPEKIHFWGFDHF